MATKRTIINGFGGAITFSVDGETYHHGFAGSMGGDISIGGTTITADPPVALIITTYSATVDAGIAGNIDANAPAALAITTNPASIDYAITGGFPALTITTYRASLNPDTFITATPTVALNITTYNATVNVGVTISVAATGTIFPNTLEDDIVTGGKTLIITLTNDTFIAASTGPIGTIANTQAFIDSITSEQNEATGWNAEVRDKEVVGAVSRDSNTQATITFSAAGSYDITGTETITASVPAEILTTSVINRTATPTFEVRSTSLSGGVEGGIPQEIPFLIPYDIPEDF